MRRLLWLLTSLTATLVAVGACTSQAPPPAQPKPEFRVTASIQDIMNSMVDPQADELWQSVATTISAAGTEERFPKTAEEWTKLRHAALTMIEASNLLQLEGRRVARPGFKSENPNIELEPEQIEALITQDRGALIKLAHGLHDAGMLALKAIEAKNVQGLSDAGETIDTACENCHLKYWYPGQGRPKAE